MPAGAAHLRWPSEFPQPFRAELPVGVLILLRQTVWADPHVGWQEQGEDLHCFLVPRRVTAVSWGLKRASWCVACANLRFGPSPSPLNHFSQV